MVSDRCQYTVVDPLTHRKRLCKYNKKFNCYCHIHINIIMYNNIVKIQKIFRGYYTRRKLKIFYNLPRDLQRKVIWHLNKDIYTRYFHTSIAKIMYNKFKNFTENTNNLQFITLKSWNDLFTIQYFMEDSKSNEYTNFKNELRHLLKLFIKYNIIINVEKIKDEMKVVSNYCEIKFSRSLSPSYYNIDNDIQIYDNFIEIYNKMI